MIIRPQGATDQQVPYAAGRFTDSDAFAINQIGAASPFGGLLCSIGSDYSVELLPDGSGCSRFAGKEVTHSSRLSKVWYIRDKESGEQWTAFFAPMGQRSDEYEVRFEPGQASVFTLKNKIATSLTIATVPNLPCEVWRLNIENRSASARTLEFTTYIEPHTAVSMEAAFRPSDNVLLMRRPLGEAATISDEGLADELVLFHSCTLPPTRFAIEKTDFVGDGRTLANPIHVEDSRKSAENGCASNLIASLTIEIELPVEGQAECGFCFGVAQSPESALRVAKALSKADNVSAAIDMSRKSWRELSSAVQSHTSDRTFDALVNTWLPYETYSGWIRQRNAPNNLDPAKVADILRCLHPLSGAASHIIRPALLSFAAGLSLLGSYSPDERSIVSIPPTELLWLVISTARYVAETGDSSILAESIALRDGPAMPLREHCDRIIRMALDTSAEDSNFGDDRLLAETIRSWSLVPGNNADHGRMLEMVQRRNLDRNESAERRMLPRRLRYLQSITPALSDKLIIDDLQDHLGSDRLGTGDVEALNALYSVLVEWTIGLSATSEGLLLNPRLPNSWIDCVIRRRFRGDTYNITLRRNVVESGNGSSMVVDGEPVLGQMLPFFGDGGVHNVEVIVG
ncbi:MAG: hypothetical protein ACOX3G_01400 [Armatimonadota bacterium]